MILTTTIEIPKGRCRIGYEDPILLMGSCFADNIGRKLSEHKFKIDQNPFGTLYNPASIAQSLERLLDPVPFSPDDLFQHEGSYHSFAHHSRFSATDESSCLEQINSRLDHSSRFLKEARILIITLGTAYVYRLKENGKVVANCHKLPERLFERSMLSTDAITQEWSSLLDKLWQHNPKLQILFTVSPIRHWKDGAHGNQLSKATLLLAVEQLQQCFPKQVHYFPAYELMMDELRDYRFYADDLLHPSNVAIEYIWQRFAESLLSNEAQALAKEWISIQKAIDHKPFRPESEAYRQFILQTLLKIERINKKITSFAPQEEEELRNRLKELGRHEPL